MVSDDPESFADLDGHCCVLETAEAGAELGTFAGPVGEVIGGVGGAILGAFLGDKAADYVTSHPEILSNMPPGDATDTGGLLGERLGQHLAQSMMEKHDASSNSSQQSQPTQEHSTPSSKETGSYTNTHESGKTYSGKGDRARSQASGKRVEKKTGDKHTATDWKKSANGREAFKDESRRIDANGGAGSNSNHNQIDSPGKKYIQQDTPNQPN